MPDSDRACARSPRTRICCLDRLDRSCTALRMRTIFHAEYTQCYQEFTFEQETHRVAHAHCAGYSGKREVDVEVSSALSEF
ncbi:hypothetical protein PDJAM_G00126810 [Pangasius djambal]|uniref:Uncharacterized protein n=1 Tax=Pangasius djambal TaxID=1691987 RepID=A0ACC5ZAI1_9TELE|nr:hypothetical protein [Pangasius djambal]